MSENNFENKSLSKFEKNIEKYKQFLSWCRWYPDLFLDLIKPESGGITLYADQRVFMRAILRFQSVYGVFPRGYGKCITFDSLVFTNEGIKEIGEFFNYNKQQEEEWLKGNNISVVNRHGELESISSLFNGGFKKTKKITTEEGFAIEGSLNHPVLIMKQDGTVGWAKIEKLKIGDFVCINRKNDIWGNKANVDIESEFEKWDSKDSLIKKEIPKSILENSKSNVFSFLKKIFNNHGIVEKNIHENKENIRIYLISRKIATQIQMCLLNLGIISVIKEESFYNNEFRYILKIQGEEYSKFNRNFIFYHNEYSKEDNYYYSKIEKIEESENYVCDVSLIETNSFVSNGFVSHNTFCEVACLILIAIFYPGIELALTAQTKENASELLKDKYDEMMKYYPILENEILGKPKFVKGDSEILFTNGSRIDILANAQTSKGQRRKRISIEESALLNNQLFEDALEPIVEVKRMTVGKLSIVDPEELNQQINFFTTSGFRASDEYTRSMNMLNGMINLTGDFVIGGEWHIAAWYGRGSTKAQMLKRKQTMSPIAFAQNYSSKWVNFSPIIWKHIKENSVNSQMRGVRYYIVLSVKI